MDTFIKADIFFFITSVSVIILTALLLVLLYYVIKTMRSVRDIADYVKHQAEEFSKDADDVRASVRAQRTLWEGVQTLFSGFKDIQNKRKGRKK